MPTRGEDHRIPDAGDAARTLADIDPVVQRSNRVVKGATMGIPLTAWGIAWVTGSLVLQFIPGAAGVVAGCGLCAAAGVISWFVGRSAEVRVGFERRFAACWTALLASSPFLVVVIAPTDRQVLVVFLSCLWAVGLLMYGIGTGDRSLTVAGALVIITAAAARLVVPGLSVLIVGLVGGAAMVVLGGRRMRWRP